MSLSKHTEYFSYIVGLSVRQNDGPPVDTMLFILRDRPDEEGNVLVAFTEQRDSKGVSESSMLNSYCRD